MSVFEEAYARYYDLLYASKDYRGESEYIARLLRGREPGVKRVLELGAGTGKHACHLAELGFAVHGVDRSAEMVKRATLRASQATILGPAPTFEVADVTGYRGSRRFDAVVALFHVVSYQVTNAAVQQIFEVASEHLAERGLFLFDIWYGPAVLESKPAVRVKRLNDADISITRIAEPTIDTMENTVDVHYSIHVLERNSATYQTFSELHRMRYFFLPELEVYLRHAGMAMEVAEEWVTGAKPSVDTWGVTVIASKTGGVYRINTEDKPEAAV